MTRSSLLLLPLLGLALAGCGGARAPMATDTDLSGLHDGQQTDRLPLDVEAKTLAARYGVPVTVTGEPAEVTASALPATSLTADLIDLISRSKPARCAAIVRNTDGLPKAILVTQNPVVPGAPFAPTPLPSTATTVCVTNLSDSDGARLWSAVPGATVRSVLMSWAQQGRYSLNWTARNDPGRTEGAAVYGAFADAAVAFAAGGSPQSNRISLTIDETRRRIVVTDWSLPQ